MKCNEARRMVVPFVKKELSERETEAFLHHIESCEDCMDELDMYYMVYHALNAMDSGVHHEYDFKKMLAEDIRSARRNIFRRKVLNVIRGILLILAELVLFLCVLTGSRMKQGISGDSILERLISRFYIGQQVTDPTDAETETMETDTDQQTELTDAAESGAGAAGAVASVSNGAGGTAGILIMETDDAEGETDVGN